MPDYTTNYALIKPKKSENYDIDDVTRKNMDTIDTQLFNKVDKIPGKGLSSCDFTEQYKTKLDGLNNYDDTDIKNSISSLKNKQKEQDTTIDDINNDINLANRNLANVIQLAMTNQKNIDTEHETNTQQDKDIEALQTENEELKAENERLRQDMNAYPSNEAEGEYITLTDSADSRFNKFKVLGKSTQATRSGKNKLDLRYLATSTNFIENVDIETGSFELVDCWSTTIMYAEHIVKLLKPDTQYKMIADVTLLEKPETLNSYNNHNRLLVLYNGSDDTRYLLTTSNATEKNDWQVNSTKHIETQFTTPSDLSNYHIRSYNYNTNNDSGASVGAGRFQYDNVMILEATEEDETFEQYGVSPSSEFSSKTRNVGDNINLFDGELEQGNINGVTGENETNTDRIRSKNYIEIPVNTDKIRVIRSVANNEFWLRFYDANKSYLGFLANDTSYNNVKILDFNMDKNAKYIRFVDLSNDLNNKIKITTDLNSFEYSPYKCGNIETDICNNNLTNTDIVASVNVSCVTINSKNSFSIDLSKGYVTLLQNKDLFFGKNDKNKRYKLSYHLHQNNSSFRPFLKIVYSDGTTTISPNNGSQTEMDVTLNSTTGKTIESIELGWGTQNNGGIATLSDIYLRQVDDNSEFQEQENQEFVFPLAEGQRLYEGSYLASDGIHHKRKQIEIDISQFATGMPYKGTFSVSNNKIRWDYTSVKGICNYFNNAESEQVTENFSASQYINDNEFNFRMGNTKDRIYFKNSAFTTLEQWRDFFNNNEVIVEYECNEYVEAYTDEQKQVYDEIVKTAKTYKTVTNIFSTNEVSPKFEIEYRQDIKSLITQQNQLFLEGGN